jgi:hypothetical protein
MCDKNRRHELLLDEYKEVGINWRYWGEVRWKHLTAFLTVSTLIGAVVYTAPLVTNRVRVFMAVAGLVLAGLFWTLEERATYYRRAYLHRALEIEQEWFCCVDNHKPEEVCGPRQYHVTRNPYWTRARSEYVFRLFYAVVAFLWALYIAAVAYHTVSVEIASLSLVIVRTAIVSGVKLGVGLQAKADRLNDRGLTIAFQSRTARMESRRNQALSPSATDSSQEVVRTIENPSGRSEHDCEDEDQAEHGDER